MSYKKNYPSDLTDMEWNIISPLIPIYKKGRKRTINMREIINGLLYLTRTGCQWDSIPITSLKNQPFGITIQNGKKTSPG